MTTGKQCILFRHFIKANTPSGIYMKRLYLSSLWLFSNLSKQCLVHKLHKTKTCVCLLYSTPSTEVNTWKHSKSSVNTCEWMTSALRGQWICTDRCSFLPFYQMFFPSLTKEVLTSDHAPADHLTFYLIFVISHRKVNLKDIDLPQNIWKFDKINHKSSYKPFK
jgi:hypothetical protein